MAYCLRRYSALTSPGEVSPRLHTLQVIRWTGAPEISTDLLRGGSLSISENVTLEPLESARRPQLLFAVKTP